MSTERGSLDAESGLIVLGDWGGEAPPITAVERSRFRERWTGRYFWKGRVVVVAGGSLGAVKEDCFTDVSETRRSKVGRETFEALLASSGFMTERECVDELEWFRTKGTGELCPLALVGEIPPVPFGCESSESSVVRTSRSVRWRSSVDVPARKMRTFVCWPKARERDGS
jgi:hypothetical protein